jgi:hypothetical protein
MSAGGRATHQRLEKYLATLPNGIDSYPECKVVANAFLDAGTSFPSIATDPDIPAVIRAAASGSSTEMWVPDVAGNVAMLLIREKSFSSDRDFLAWFREEVAGRVFTRPMFRALFRLVSPSLAFMGAARRWSGIRQGTSLAAAAVQTVGKSRRGQLTLTTPPNLFSDPVLYGRHGEGFLKVLKLAGAQHLDQAIRVESPTTIHYEYVWRA